MYTGFCFPYFTYVNFITTVQASHDYPCFTYREREKHVLVGFGCHKKYHSLGGLNNRNLFLKVLEAGKSESKDWKVWFLVRIIFLDCRWLAAFSL